MCTLDRSMVFLPDDSPSVATLRNELEDERGSMHLEVGRLVSSESSVPTPSEAVSALVGDLGFAPPSEWTTLSPEEAVDFVRTLLARGPGHGGRATPPAEAEQLASRVRKLFSDRAMFLTLGDKRAERSRAPSRDGALDSGLLVVDGARAGLVWVEDPE